MFEFVHFGFDPDDVLSLNLEEFDEALEILLDVHKKHGLEELIRTNTATQGDRKAIKKLAKEVSNRTGDIPLGTGTGTEYLHRSASAGPGETTIYKHGY